MKLRATLREFDLVFGALLQHGGGGGGHCFHSQVKNFVFQMPSSHSLHSGGGGGGSYFREETKISPIMSVMHQIPGVASS